MNTEEIERLERELKISLPTSYRIFLLSYPEGVASVVGDFELIADAGRLLEMNTELRAKPFYRFPPWPNHLFAIGENGCGDYYFLDLKDRSGTVRFVDHEKLNDERLASNVQEWIPSLLAEKKNEEKA
jgi:hypothetical protein